MAGQRSPEEIVKAELVESLVNPSEAAWTAARIRTLEAQVQEALDRHDDEAARQVIYGYGITPTSQRTVDAVVYLAKNAYLNSRVNPATLARWERFAARFVDASLKSGEYAKALAATRRIGLAAAYPENIDGLLDASAGRAAEQHVPEDAAKGVAASYAETIYMLIAPRAGFETPDYLVPARKWQDLVARLEKLQNLEVPTTGFEPGFEPDWSALEAVLADLRRALIEDDVSEKDATTIVNALLEAYKALVPKHRNGLTTYELNTRLRELQADAHARVMKAMAEERARLAAEKARLAAEKARQAQQEAEERSRDLQRLWTAMLKQMAEAIDFPARETAFTAAISDRVEPAVNRMLGEGARALRLYRIQGSITKPQATSLLLAARLRNPVMAAMLLPASDVDAVDAKGRAAVHFATAAGDLRTLRILVSGGASTSVATSAGDDLVTLACAANAEDVLVYLLDELKRPVGERSVSWCVIHDKVLPLKTLVSHGGVLTDRHLAAAVKLALPDMVRYLVERGCDVNAPSVHQAAAALALASPTASAAIPAALDAPWVALSGDDTASIATPDNPAAAEVLLYLHSQGYRPKTSKGR